MSKYMPDRTPASKSWPRYRLERGIDVLDAWSQTATQAARNAVYRVLFSVLDGSVFRRYRTIDSHDEPQEFGVFLNENLVMRLRLDDGTFTIDHIGPAFPEHR